jgi:hypothetical protein
MLGLRPWREIVPGYPLDPSSRDAGQQDIRRPQERVGLGLGEDLVLEIALHLIDEALDLAAVATVVLEIELGEQRGGLSGVDGFGVLECFGPSRGDMASGS